MLLSNAKQSGRYLVSKIVLVVPGVLSGNKGALLYTPDELRKSAPLWNNVPIVVNHPVDMFGLPVSAADPTAPDTRIGEVRNAKFNGALVAEGWFDIDRVKDIAPDIYESLVAGRPIEISTGLFTDHEPAPKGATYNGRGYSFVTKNHKPDHLAVLPDQVGACSLRDGCGVLS